MTSETDRLTNLLTYLLTYLSTYVPTYLPTYLALGVRLPRVGVSRIITFFWIYDRLDIMWSFSPRRNVRIDSVHTLLSTCLRFFRVR